MTKRFNELDILKVLHENQGKLFDSSKVADYFNARKRVYDAEIEGIIRQLRKVGIVHKVLKEPFIGYEISPAGMKYLKDCSS